MDIDREQGHGRVSAAGPVRAAAAVALAASALAEAHAARLSTVLMDFRNLFLLRSLSTTECYLAGEELARAGRGLGRVALVARSECIEAHDFVITVARSRGLLMAPFVDQGEALHWLQMREVMTGCRAAGG